MPALAIFWPAERHAGLAVNRSDVYPSAAVTEANVLHGSFTLDEFDALLERTQALYDFAGFDVLGHAEMPESFCILRHDIDMSPSHALQLAHIEAKRGISATYMVLPTGYHYSPFERSVAEKLREIASLGHEIGLHFDASWHGIEDEESLPIAISREAAALQDLVGIPKVSCFSFHVTTPFTMSARRDSYGDLWNAYAGRLQDSVSYVSDSNGLWRFRSWADALEERPERLQILTHPEWWQETETSPAEKIARLLDQRSQAAWDAYVRLVMASGRPVLCPEPELERALLEGLDDTDLLRRWLTGDRMGAYFHLIGLIEEEKQGGDWHHELELHDPLVSQLRRTFQVDPDLLLRAFLSAALLLQKLRADRPSTADQ